MTDAIECPVCHGFYLDLVAHAFASKQPKSEKRFIEAHRELWIGLGRGKKGVPRGGPN